MLVTVTYYWSDGAVSVTEVDATTLPFRPYACAFSYPTDGIAIVGVEETP